MHDRHTDSSIERSGIADSRQRLPGIVRLAATLALAAAPGMASAQGAPGPWPAATVGGAPTQPPSNPPPVRVAVASASPSAATALPASPADPDDAIRAMIERTIGPGQRVEVKVGQLDPRMQLAPCRRAEPFLPPAVRLWGRTSIGVRCVDGASWSVLLPVSVSVFGPALVAANPLAAGAAPSASDFVVEEIDLTREPTPVVQDPAELDGKLMVRPLAAGQALRRDAMRAPPVVSAGDPVRILIVGQGFTITGEGVAMAAAAEGQKLRVRTEHGRVVTGEVRGRTVELRL